MIVVLGTAALRTGPDGSGRPAGLAAGIAVRAAAAGAAVELVAKVGEDGAGEELLLALARAGVGHLAVLRDAGRPTPLAPDDPVPPDEEALVADLVAGATGAGEPERSWAGEPPGPPSQPQEPAGVAASVRGLDLDAADVALGLEYLRDYRVVVAVEPLGEGSAPVLVDAAAFAEATLVVVAAPDTAPAPAYARSIVVEAPPDDPDGAFAALVGRFAAAVDRGTPAAEAFRSATAAGGWEPAAG